MSLEASKPVDKKLYIFIAVIVIIMVWGTWNSNDKDDQITRHQKVTVGQVIRNSLKPKKRIKFSYYIDAVKYQGSDLRKGSHPARVRLSKPIPGEYYDSRDHTNHRIVIGKTPLDPFSEIQKGYTVEGCVKRKMAIDNYRDLYIDYKVKGELFSFRARLHKDSLNLYDSESCEKLKGISIQISNKYPIFNDLYFKSRDRQYKGAYSTEGKWNE